MSYAGAEEEDRAETSHPIIMPHRPTCTLIPVHPSLSQILHSTEQICLPKWPSGLHSRLTGCGPEGLSPFSRKMRCTRSQVLPQSHPPPDPQALREWAAGFLRQLRQVVGICLTVPPQQWRPVKKATVVNWVECSLPRKAHPSGPTEHPDLAHPSLCGGEECQDPATLKQGGGRSFRGPAPS